MKKFLMAAIAVFMMAGTSVASENVAVVENNVTTTVSENAVDKVIAMVKGYIQKINAAKTMEELMGLAEAFGEEMMSLEEKYGDEIARFAHKTRDAVPFSADHETGAPLEINLRVVPGILTPVKTGEPQVELLQLLHGTGKVHYLGDLEVLGGTGGSPDRSRSPG